MIDVLLVDDHASIRQAMGRLLDNDAELTVIGEAGSLAEARALLLRLASRLGSGSGAVLICDVSLPDGSGLQAVRAARAAHPDLGIVVLTMHEDDRTLLEALDAGASALVHKSASYDALVTAVGAAARQPGTFVAEGLADALRRERARPVVHLTPREREVLVRLVAGDSVAQVAAALFMSESTVKTHVSKIYDKLGAHNRATATRTALQLGLVAAEG